jgi:hypothetical protein
MSKYNRQPLQAPPLGANVTDHEFATGYFQELVAAVMSGFLGTTRSAQSAQGHLWSKVADGGVSLVFFDGNTDHEWAKWTQSEGLVVSADKLGGKDAAHFEDIPARLGYTPPWAPKATSGSGQWVGIGAAIGGSLQLPAGGTWAYHVNLFVNGAPAGRVTGVSAGGAVIYAGSPPVTPDGFAWRIL